MTHDALQHIHESDPPFRAPQRNQSTTQWTTELEDRVRDLWKTHSATEIASELNGDGYTFSRGAIIGKIHRLGLTVGQKKVLHQNTNRGDTPSEPRRKPGIAVVEVDPDGFPEARVYGLDSLEPHHCRFECTPHDQYDAARPVFCGLPILASSRFSYCSGHHARLTVKPLKTWGGKAA